MTIAIITASDGTRYRRTGQFPRQGNAGVTKEGAFCDTWASTRDQWKIEALEALPVIPNWPGLRPEQYLAVSTEQPDCPVHDDDVIAVQRTSGINEWTMGVVYGTQGGKPLSFFGDAYLVRRADTTEDA